MKRIWNKSLAFILMLILLIGDVVPAFASETLNPTVLSAGSYRIGDAGELTAEDILLTEITETMVKPGVRRTQNDCPEEERAGKERIPVSGNLDTVTEVTAEIKLQSTKDVVIESEVIDLGEEAAAETQETEGSVFVLFAEESKPQYFYALEALKGYINAEKNSGTNRFDIEIRQNIVLDESTDFSGIPETEIRLDLCGNTINVTGDAIIPVNGIYNGNIVIAEGKTLTLLPVYDSQQEMIFMDCFGINFDFGGTDSKLVLGDNQQSEKTYTQINLNESRFLGSQNATMELNGNICLAEGKGYEKLLKDGQAAFLEEEILIINELIVNNDIFFPFIMKNDEEWYEGARIGVPVVANRFSLNGETKVFGAQVKDTVFVSGKACLRYSSETALSKVEADVQNLSEDDLFELQCEQVYDGNGNKLSEGSLIWKGISNVDSGRTLVSLNKYKNFLSEHTEEENSWIEERHDWENSGYGENDIVFRLEAKEGNTVPEFQESLYDIVYRGENLGLKLEFLEEEQTYVAKVCRYPVFLNVFERIFTENENGNWHPKFLYQKGFESLEQLNSYIKANEDKQKQFNVILAEDLLIEDANKDILDYSGYQTHVELILDGYDVTVEADAVIRADYIDGSRCRNTDNGTEIIAVSKVRVLEGKKLTISTQELEEDRNHLNVYCVRFEFDNSDLILGKKEVKSHIHFEEVGFETSVRNLTIFDSFYYGTVLNKENKLQITENFTVYNRDAEAGIYLPLICENMELDGNVSVSDYVASGLIKVSNISRFNVVADGKAELNEIEVALSEENKEASFNIALNQQIELGAYREFTAEQWEAIFENWEDELVVPDDVFSGFRTVSERGAVTINGEVKTQDGIHSPIMLEKLYCWNAVRESNPEEEQQFAYGVEFVPKTAGQDGEVIAVVLKAVPENFMLNYPDVSLKKFGNDLKATASEAGLLKEGTGQIVEYETFAEAVAAIDSKKDLTANYVIFLRNNLGSEDDRITLKLPKYAKKVIITSDNYSTIYCKNAISQATNVRFEYVEFNSTTNYEAKKYTLEVCNGTFLANNVTVKELYVARASVILDGKVTATQVTVPELRPEEINSSSITAYNTISITDISGKGILEVWNAFTKKAWKKAATQMTVKGTVSKEVVLDLRPFFYDVTDKNYYGFLNEEGYFDWEMFREQVLDLMVTGNETPANFKKILNAKNIVEPENILFYGMDHENIWPMIYKGGIYFTNVKDAISVEILKPDKENVLTESLGDFRSWNDAIQAIEQKNHADWEYVIRVHGEIGSGRDVPLKTLTLPKKAKCVSIVGEGDGSSTLITTSKKITLNTDLVLKNILLGSVKKSGNSYENNTFLVNVGKHSLKLENMINQMENLEIGMLYESRMNITGTKDSFLDISFVDVEGYFLSSVYQIKNVGNVNLHAAVFESEEGKTEYGTADYYIADGISGVTKLVLDKGVNVAGTKDISVKNLSMGANIAENTREDMWANIQGKNLTVSEETIMNFAGIKTGSDVAGDGKITLNNITFLNTSNHMEGKVDKKNKSQVNIKGNVNVASEEIPAGDSVVTISLCTKDSDYKYVQLEEGMTLLTAPKAAAGLFRPDYDWRMEENGKEDDFDPTNDIPNEEGRRMGWEEWLVAEREGNRDMAPAGGLYNSGNEINYGVVRELSEDGTYIRDKSEVRLWLGTTSLDEQSWNQFRHMDFKNFEDAVTAIDKMAFQVTDPDTGRKVYQTYLIELLNDVEIGNEKKDGKYKTLKLPSKASEVVLVGNYWELRYTGNLNLRCNTTIESMVLKPLKYTKSGVIPMKSNFVLGNYTLTNYGFDCGYLEKPEDPDTYVSCVGKISGSAKSGKLVMKVWAVLEAESVSGLKTLEFSGNGEEYGYAHSWDENGNIIYMEDENGNKIKYRSVLITTKDVNVKELVFNEHAVGHLGVLGKLTVDSITVDGEVETELIRYADKAMKVKGTVIKKVDNSKRNESVIFVPYEKDGKEQYSELKLSLISKNDGSDIKEGMTLMTGKYLNADDWKVNVIKEEDSSVLFEGTVTGNTKNTELYFKKQ